VHFLKVVMHLGCKPLASIRFATLGIS